MEAKSLHGLSARVSRSDDYHNWRKRFAQEVVQKKAAPERGRQIREETSKKRESMQRSWTRPACGNAQLINFRLDVNIF